MNSRSPGNRPRSERGLAIVLSLFLVLVLSGLVAATLHEGLGHRAAVTHVETSARALELAETGLLAAELEIATQRDPDADGIGTVTGTYGGGTYEVVATQQALLPNNYTVEAVGQHGLSARRIEVELRRIPRMPFRYTMFAKKDIGVAGSVQTDSFDSRLGTWKAQATNSDAGGSYADGGGDIGANGDVKLGGSSAIIRGDARPGPLGATTSTGSPTIWGSTAPRGREEPVPDVPLSAFMDAWSTNDNGQFAAAHGYDAATMSLIPTGSEKIVLHGGTYFVTDIIFEGSTKLIVKGPARVYVTGNCHLRGGTIQNKTGQAENLLLFVHHYSVPPGFVWTPRLEKKKPLPPILIAGGASSAFAMYAPSVDVLLTGNANLFGSVVGQNIKVEGNPSFHYDRALGFIDLPGPKYCERIYWVERSVPPR